MRAIDFFDQAAARFSDRVAVTHGASALTYGELDSIAASVANALLSCGLPKGSHIAILSPNDPLVLACQYGILRAGHVWVPTNYRNVRHDIITQFNKIDVAWLFYHSSLESMVEGMGAEAEVLRGMVPLDAPSGGRPALSDWCADHALPVPLPETAMDDVIFVGSTGGTSGGALKGVVHTNRSWELSIANFYALHHFEEPPVHLVVAPLTHAAGVFHWGMVGMGATHVLCPSADPATIFGMIEEHRVSILFLPPTIIYMLLAYPDIAKYDLSSLRYLALGSAPMSVQKLKEAAPVFGATLYQAFGSTETLILNACMTREQLAEAVASPALEHRLASVGRAGPLSQVAIMADNGDLLPPGERGEIVIRSGMVMHGYYKDEDRTLQSRAFGWHHTGDIGTIDEDGFIYLVDRKNDMIITGGFNVYPGEIEQVIMGHPSIEDCAVVGVPHEKWGEMVVAAVQLKPGAAFDEAGFMQFCREELGGVRAPKAVEVLGEMPRSPVGKTLRRVVRDQLTARSLPA